MKKLVFFEQRESMENLILLFSHFEKRDFIPADNALKDDLQKSISVIQIIEDMEMKRKDYKTSNAKRPKKKYRSYLQQAVNDLDSILKRYPVNVGVHFEAYEAPAKVDGTSFKKLSDAIGKKFNNLREKISLSELKFHLLMPSFQIKFYGNSETDVSWEFNEDSARTVLTSGLFYYLYQLIENRFIRPRKCRQCQEWFLAVKTNHFYCAHKCQNLSRWNSMSKQARRIRWKDASKKYRERVKSGESSLRKRK